MSDVRPSRMRLRSWRPYRSGRMLGFAALDLPCGLQIADVMVCANAQGELFAQLPQRARLRQGQLQRGSDGKPVYDAPIVWQSRQLQDGWSAAVVALVRERAPQDLAIGDESGGDAAA